jgi:hypothetical protein
MGKISAIYSATCSNAPESPGCYRRYLMGQASGKAAIINYTHLNKVKEQFERAADREFRPLTEAIDWRSRRLDLIR